MSLEFLLNSLCVTTLGIYPEQLFCWLVFYHPDYRILGCFKRKEVKGHLCLFAWLYLNKWRLNDMAKPSHKWGPKPPRAQVFWFQLWFFTLYHLNSLMNGKQKFCVSYLNHFLLWESHIIFIFLNNWLLFCYFFLQNRKV